MGGYGTLNMTSYAIEALNQISAWAVGEGPNNQAIAKYSGDEWAYYPSPTHQILYGLTFPTAWRGWAVGANAILNYVTPGYDFTLFLPLLLR